MKPPCTRWLGVAVLLVVLGLTPHATAQQPVIHYFYDDLGRLVGVVDPDGNVATYAYDAVGNILAIDRHNVADAPGSVAVTLISPNHGKIGTPVSIFGKGFSPDLAQNAVSFGGAIAAVSATTANSLTTTVPPGALTGFITVTTPLGTATSLEPFAILGVVSISPTGTVLFPTQTQQFTATVSGATTPSVAWSINGIVGGNATTGTISPTGLCTAPAAVPLPSTITVTATNTSDSSLFASATVVIVEAPDKILAHPVSLAFATPTAQTAFLTASPVGVTFQPVITSVTPSSGTRGVVGLSVLLIGAGITGATGVSFQLNGSDDANLSVTDLAVSPDGTQAAFTLAIASGAIPGPRVVRITTSGGTSTASATGGNIFTVQ